MSGRSRCARGLWLVLPLGLTAERAHAHLVSSGLGPFFDGAGHFFLSVETLLPVLVLLLLAASAGIEMARRASLQIPVLWIAGAALAWPLPASGVLTSAATPLVLLAAGIALAVQRLLLSAPLLVAGGFLLGYAEGSVLHSLAPSLSLWLGTACSLLVAASLVPAATLTFLAGPPWRRVVVRVMGSWLAAIGLLMLGWLLATPR